MMSYKYRSECIDSLMKDIVPHLDGFDGVCDAVSSFQKTIFYDYATLLDAWDDLGASIKEAIPNWMKS